MKEKAVRAPLLAMCSVNVLHYPTIDHPPIIYAPCYAITTLICLNDANVMFSNLSFFMQSETPPFLIFSFKMESFFSLEPKGVEQEQLERPYFTSILLRLPHGHHPFLDFQKRTSRLLLPL